MKKERVIRRPIFTEKSFQEANRGRYTFEVDPKTNKKEIASAVKEAFKVDVSEVKVINLKGRRVRLKGTRLTRPARRIKKAIVQVGPGQKIPAFETG